MRAGFYHCVQRQLFCAIRTLEEPRLLTLRNLCFRVFRQRQQIFSNLEGHLALCQLDAGTVIRTHKCSAVPGTVGDIQRTAGLHGDGAGAVQESGIRQLQGLAFRHRQRGVFVDFKFGRNRDAQNTAAVCADYFGASQQSDNTLFFSQSRYRTFQGFIFRHLSSLGDRGCRGRNVHDRYGQQVVGINTKAHRVYLRVATVVFDGELARNLKIVSAGHGQIQIQSATARPPYILNRNVSIHLELRQLFLTEGINRFITQRIPQDFRSGDADLGNFLRLRCSAINREPVTIALFKVGVVIGQRFFARVVDDLVNIIIVYKFLHLKWAAKGIFPTGFAFEVYRQHIGFSGLKSFRSILKHICGAHIRHLVPMAVCLQSQGMARYDCGGIFLLHQG